MSFAIFHIQSNLIILVALLTISISSWSFHSPVPFLTQLICYFLILLICRLLISNSPEAFFLFSWLLKVVYLAIGFIYLLNGVFSILRLWICSFSLQSTFLYQDSFLFVVIFLFQPIYFKASFCRPRSSSWMFEAAKLFIPICWSFLRRSLSSTVFFIRDLFYHFYYHSFIFLLTTFAFYLFHFYPWLGACLSLNIEVNYFPCSH